MKQGCTKHPCFCKIGKNEVQSAPKFIAGLSTLREKVVLIIDARILFGKNPFLTEKFTILMLKINGSAEYGIIVDEASSVMQADSDSIQVKNSTFLSTSVSEGVLLHNKEIYLVINPEKIINENTKEFLKNAQPVA